MTTTDMDAAVAALRDHERFLVTSHESPDGDALGSLLATHLALEQLGKDTVMALTSPAPLPAEYAFLDLLARGLQRQLPPDHADRVLVAVDCAQETRLTDDAFLDASVIVNIDHHHDNTRFGSVDLVVPSASSTGEVLADVLVGLGVTLTTEIAEALYTAIVTDTGRFQYANTTPKALRLAAELVEAGADAHKVFQVVYESVEFAKLKLLARALERAEVYDGGRVVVSHLLRRDFSDVGAAEPYSEGIIDYLRAVEGAELAVLVREQPPGAPHACKVSLRAAVDEIDVSVIARKSNGGGHRQAAGFSSDDSIAGVTAFVRREFSALAAAASAEG